MSKSDTAEPSAGKKGEQKPQQLPEEILCIGCKETKHRSEFSSSDKMRGTGTSSYCKKCQVDVNTLYRYRDLAASDADKLHAMREDLVKRIEIIDKAFANPRAKISKPKKKPKT